ncbi:DUF4388 domain-containing protein [Oceanithermus sp.]|uniref:DUF4388 domain-containing protein n=1 Tax=Oceanithermus sp. TaxID=2268145 RepID=UPI0025FA2AD9|nr:DUF4388 domain-containing protein [Oceanithermus sp.]
MAIFGSLNHMSLGDLLPLLAAQDGALEIFNLERQPRVTLYISKGTLYCLSVGGRPVDTLQARSVVGELMNARRGSFEFLPGARARRCEERLDLRMDRLLVALTSTQDEFMMAREHLPHPDTVFRAVGEGGPEDGRLEDFWGRARDRLAAGASAQTLAAELDMPLDHVRFYLYKLRQAGNVEPVRVRATRPSGDRSQLASRLLNSLRRRFFGQKRDGAWNP